MKHLIYILLFGIFAGCHVPEDRQDSTSESKHFVQVYVVPEEIEARSSVSDGCIVVVFDGERISNWENSLYRDNVAFEKISNRYGDNSYNKRVHPGDNPALSVPLDYISITCSTDFNGIEAGNSLNSQFVFYGTSAFPFIESGYKQASEFKLPDYLKGIDIFREPNFWPIAVNLEDLCYEEDTRLLSPVFRLYFPEGPPKGKYTFEISIEVENAVLTCQVEYENG